MVEIIDAITQLSECNNKYVKAVARYTKAAGNANLPPDKYQKVVEDCNSTVYTYLEDCLFYLNEMRPQARKLRGEPVDALEQVLSDTNLILQNILWNFAPNPDLKDKVFAKVSRKFGVMAQRALQKVASVRARRLPRTYRMHISEIRLIPSL